MATEKVKLDRRCPYCGGRIDCVFSRRMTYAHCENECGFGITSGGAGVPVEAYPTPEDAYDAMAEGHARGLV